MLCFIFISLISFGIDNENVKCGDKEEKGNRREEKRINYINKININKIMKRRDKEDKRNRGSIYKQVFLTISSQDRTRNNGFKLKKM